jgi:hypothetical protein
MTHRRFVYIPKINQRTFLFFYFEGNSGRSYTFRDYSMAGGVRKTEASQYSYTADQILGMAEYSFDAPRHHTDDFAFWHKQVSDLNSKYLVADTDQQQVKASEMNPSRQGTVKPVDPPPPPNQPTEATLPAGFGGLGFEVLHPVFGFERLLGHPVKGAKRQDLERILTSRNSEDWVTWNVAQLLHLVGSSEWWPQLVQLAAQDNDDLERELLLRHCPELELWKKMPAPGDYEVASRERLAQSTDPLLAARSLNPKAVEGDSEIDLVLDSKEMLGLLEAKLGSDASLRTKYDPDRNQIVRNIDCLLEARQGRTAVFWMLVADKGAGRTYTQLVREYQSSPSKLVASLPHRPQTEVEAVARNLALILWRDLLDVITPRIEAILTELSRRVSSVA